MVSLRTLGAIASFICLTYAAPYPHDFTSTVDSGLEPTINFSEPSKADNIASLTRRATGGVVSGAAAVNTINNHDGIGAGSDSYKMYWGDGSREAGWPTQEQWVSFEDMWNANKNKILRRSCGWNNWGQENSEAEIGALYDAIQQIARETKVDHRFILAVVIQESKGCVRVTTTSNADPNIFNPGLMQSHSGSATCMNKVPCPRDTIVAMVREGTAGTVHGDGLAHVLNQAQNTFHVTHSRAFYLAAKYYNGGSIPASNKLEDGCCTRCYASDIANRLTGWVLTPTGCPL